MIGTPVDTSDVLTADSLFTGYNAEASHDVRR